MIDWQLQLTFNDFLRYFYIQTQLFYFIYEYYSMLSECRRYGSLTVAVTLTYMLLFLLLHVLAYVQWQPFTYTSKFLPITVVFVCLLHISSLGFAVVYFAFACAPQSGDFRGFVVAFLAFFTVVFKTFCCRFFVFQQFE